MGAGLAAGLVYAVGTVWKRRRHRYRPTPITSPVLRDADLAPPLAALILWFSPLRRYRDLPAGSVVRAAAA